MGIRTNLKSEIYFYNRERMIEKTNVPKHSYLSERYVQFSSNRVANNFFFYFFF